MSRYLLLFLLNLPFVLMATLSAITQYKLNRSSRRRLIVQIALWITILLGLATAEPLYSWLFRNNLTQTEPLSLFDVVQITAIVLVLSLALRAYNKSELIEQKYRQLHQELSIILSERK
jgi:hypothetical protein